MIKMARFDDGVGKQCRPMIQYARKDYVELELLKSFVEGTVCFAVIAGTYCMYAMDDIMERIARMDIIPILTTCASLYIVFMAAYLTATYIVFQKKYTWGRRKVKKYYNSLKKVNQIYERDEHLKRTPVGTAE
jgi:hypothetical protein